MKKIASSFARFFPIWVGWFTFSPPLRIDATRRGSPVQSRDSHLNKKGEIKSCSAILTVVAIDESSMGRRGLMEVIFQGVREVGSGVGNTGPIRSLESIKDPRWLMEKIKMCVCDKVELSTADSIYEVV